MPPGPNVVFTSLSGPGLNAFGMKMFKFRFNDNGTIKSIGTSKVVIGDEPRSKYSSV